MMRCQTENTNIDLGSTSVNIGQYYKDSIHVGIGKHVLVIHMLNK